MNKTKTYTAVDFENYHQGKMPLQDMYALEKAALDDVFLADALDGYQYTNTAIDDVALLQRKLLLTKKKDNYIVLWLIRKAIRVAASLFIFIGLGLGIYLLNKKIEKTAIAKKDSKQNTIIKNEINAIADTTILLTDNNTAAVKPLPIPSAIVVQMQPLLPTTNNIENTKPVIVPDYTNTDSKKINEATATLADDTVYIAVVTQQTLTNKAQSNNVEAEVNNTQLKARETTANTNNQPAIASNTYNYSGTLQLPTGGPMQNATIVVRNNNTITQTDNFGRYKFVALDSVANVTIAAKGYANKDISLNANTVNISKNETIKNEAEPNGVSDYAFKKATQPIDNSNPTTQQSNIIDKNIAKEIAVQKEIENNKQQTVTNNFNTYVSKNIVAVYDKYGVAIKGMVTVSFVVNTKGEPKKIRIKKKLSDACDKQAISLVKNAPVWLYNQSKTQLATVIF